jgi:hypothetical protein
VSAANRSEQAAELPPPLRLTRKFAAPLSAATSQPSTSSASWLNATAPPHLARSGPSCAAKGSSLFTCAIRAARQRAQTAALAPQRRGPQSKSPTALEEELAGVRREKAQLEEKLRQAELIIELQKKSPSCLG